MGSNGIKWGCIRRQVGIYALHSNSRMKASLVGNHSGRLDANGRVSLPVSFRKTLGSGPLVLLQWEAPRLDLYRRSVWEPLEEKLIASRNTNPATASHIRSILADAAEVEPDPVGRIRIPVPLRRCAGLAQDVVFAGMLDRVEIWRPKEYALARKPSEAGMDVVRAILG